MSKTCMLKAYNDHNMDIESHNDHLHWFGNQPMVGNWFAYILKMGQTKSFRLKFMVIFFSKSKFEKTWNPLHLYFYT